ncbi:hypothetical protein HMPREF9098_1685 [Kingella denitrificans ATCC 33394]|uniref:Uncharacterized protein n=1 Tax=Kingella denitrificans ATCC 33394 TaxID=888741 RepID=F0F0Q0_9NEIS|nr:hypothetical protein HMPREF9098_1685 [Kingella denitrificans ATCC 33394]
MGRCRLLFPCHQGSLQNRSALKACFHVKIAHFFISSNGSPV